MSILRQLIEISMEVAMEVGEIYVDDTEVEEE